jgi:hypothetical protein
MSDLSNDKEALEGKREQLSEEAVAPLRDQIVKKLFKSLKEEEIGSVVSGIWEKGLSERVLWSERQQAWLASWDEHLIADTSGPFAGSSQLHIPMPFQVCKTMHARFLQAIWQDPPFNVKAQNEASIDNLDVVRDVMRYYIMRGANDNKGVGKIIDAWVWDWVTLGSGVMKLRWDIRYSRFIDVEEYMEQKDVQVVTDQEGNQQVVPVMGPAEREVVREHKCFDGPVFDLVDLEDLLIVGGNGEPDSADAVIHRNYLTASELWTLADRKIFDKDAVEEIIQGGGDRKDGALASEVKQQRTRNAGHSQLDHEQDLDRYEILEAYLRRDVDGSGINSDIIVWTHKRTGKLLHATYLYRVSRRGERPFAKIDFHPRKGQEYGTGMVELLYPLSREMDAMHNMRIDFGMISNMPFGFYRPSSNIDPETIKFEPGSLIPVDNPQADIYFPNMGNRTSFGMQEEAAIQQMVERITSISDLSYGMMSSQGATRTATGARALVGEMSSNLDVYLRRLNFGWEKALRYLLDMLQVRMPQGLAFRLTGETGSDVFRKLNNARDIYGDFDIEVSPNSATSNANMQLEQAQQIAQITSDPLAIQLGIVTPAQYYNARENLLKALGVKDSGKYLQKPQGPLRVLTPAEEFFRVVSGMPVQVTPEMDHQGFIALIEEVKGSPEIYGQLDQAAAQDVERQAMQHIQMMQALEQKKAQSANFAQQQQNAQMAGQNMAPSVAGPQAINQSQGQ